MRQGGRVGAACGEQAPDQLRYSMGLSDGERSGSTRWIEALDPAQAARRPLHAEKGGRRRKVRCLIAESSRHTPSTCRKGVKCRL